MQNVKKSVAYELDSRRSRNEKGLYMSTLSVLEAYHLVREQVYEAESKLLLKTPDHQLLTYLNIVDRIARREAWLIQLTSFGRNNVLPSIEDTECIKERTFASTKYLEALQAALKKNSA